MNLSKQTISPVRFLGGLNWLDGTPMLDNVEPYRRRILTDALWSFEADGVTPAYNLVLAGRGKKNWKTTDVILASLYRLLCWRSPLGNVCYVLANDLGQANDDLELAKLIVEANPKSLGQYVRIRQRTISLRAGTGMLEILPAKDVTGTHGKTYLFCAFDEIHGYRNWDLLEALAPDPTRRDAMRWITSYSSFYNYRGAPLHDLVENGKGGDDPRMFFSWYDAYFCTDAEHEADARTPEERANPSMVSWNNSGYLEQQKRRLPTHKYRRLHLNLPAVPEGAAYDAGRIAQCTPQGIERRKAKPEKHEYFAFVDMSGGSNDDAVLAIAHYDADREKRVLDLVVNQQHDTPFDPRVAVKRFARWCKRYRVFTVEGDRYAGETFRRDFEEYGVNYDACEYSAGQLYEELEPLLNSGDVELLDIPELELQLTTLVWRGRRIDHPPGAHDDWSNAAAGALVRCQETSTIDLW